MNKEEDIFVMHLIIFNISGLNIIGKTNQWELYLFVIFTAPPAMPSIPGMPVTTPINLPGMPPITGKI